MNKNEIRAIKDSFPFGWMKSLGSVDQKNHRYLQTSLKWFNNCPSLYRAILLAVTTAFDTDLAEEFYKNHSNDKALEKLTVLDPFMRSGAILAEALRLNMQPVGIELNPVAWFFAKTLLEPVKKNSLNTALKRLSKRKNFEDQSLEDTLAGYYKTKCPCCGEQVEKADIIHTFWIQAAICSNDQCQKRVPLFDNFIIYQKNISIKYYPDTNCPSCNKAFDWEIEPASLIAEQQLMFNSPGNASGVGRGGRRWAYGESEVDCPWCGESTKPDIPANNAEQKKVSITILLCPYCQAVWQYRGSLPQNVRCPGCGSSYYPRKGNIQQKKWYVCPFCGTTDKISNSYRQLSENQRLHIFPYAIEGQCSSCKSFHKNKKAGNIASHQCLLWKSKGRFFKQIESNDLALYLACYQIWNKHQDDLPLPDSEILDSKETHRLIENKYRFWIQLFNARQLLSLSSLLKGIDQEKNEKSRNQLLLAFLLTLETNNLFTVYNRKRSKAEGIFSKTGFNFPFGYVENNVWGRPGDEGTFQYYLSKVCENADFLKQPFDWRPDAQGLKRHFSGETLFSNTTPPIWCSNLNSLVSQNFLKKADLIITEAPAAETDPFTEWADFYYAWLKLSLKKRYSFFTSKHSKRINELNYSNRTKNQHDFYQRQFKDGLDKSRDLLKSNGLLILIYHYKTEKAWLEFLSTILDAGYVIESLLPIKLTDDDREKGTQTNTFRLLHICRLFRPKARDSGLSIQNLHKTIYAMILSEVEWIYQNEQRLEALTVQEIQFLLIGWSLNYLSEVYPLLPAEKQSLFTLEEIFLEIRIFIDHALSNNLQLSEELLEVDAESYVYFAYLAGLHKIKASELEMLTQNILGTESLKKAGIIQVDKTRRERTYTIIHPLDRFDLLIQQFSSALNAQSQQQACFDFINPNERRSENLFVNKLHLLLGLGFYDEDLSPWLRRWQSDINKIKEGCIYLKTQSEDLGELADKLLEKI